MRWKLSSLVAAVLVTLTVSIPTPVSSQAIVLITAFQGFAGFDPGEALVFAFENHQPADTSGTSGFTADYSLLLSNTSSAESNVSPCEATFETEVAFTGAAMNYLRVRFENDGTQSLLHVGSDSFHLDSCFDGATSLFAGIGRTMPTDAVDDDLFINVWVVHPDTGATRAVVGPFSMPVKDVFAIRGRGTVGLNFGEVLESYFAPPPSQPADDGGIANVWNGTVTISNSTPASSTGEPCEKTVEVDRKFFTVVVNYFKVRVVGGFERRLKIGEQETPLPACFDGATSFLVGLRQGPASGVMESDPEGSAPGRSQRLVYYRVAGADGDTRAARGWWGYYTILPYLEDP